MLQFLFRLLRVFVSFGILIIGISVLLQIYIEQTSESSHYLQSFKENMSYRPASVFVVGATGEVGKEVVKVLGKHPNVQNITLIGRRKAELPTSEPNFKPEKFKQVIVDFDNLNDYAKDFEGHDVGICALGTTRGKAGAAGFYKVDHDYVLNTAKLAKDGGTKHFALVSGGANKNSMFLYMRTKGEVEEEIKDIGFDRLSIYHPGLLLCDRTEPRFLEKCFRVVAGTFDRWRTFSIETSVVASAIVKNIFQETDAKVETLDHATIRELGKSSL